MKRIPCPKPTKNGLAADRVWCLRTLKLSPKSFILSPKPFILKPKPSICSLKIEHLEAQALDPKS